MSATLHARAERAAAAMIAEHDLSRLGVSNDLLVPVLAIGWLEGWDAGMVEAKEAVLEVASQHTRSGLHSVPSRPQSEWPNPWTVRPT